MDALTAIARDQQRGDRIEVFLMCLADHLTAAKSGVTRRINKTRAALEAAAAAADDVNGGYWGGRTNFAARLPTQVQALIEQDKGEWADLLRNISNDEPWRLRRGIGRRLKDMSPFRDQLLIFADYGCGFGSLEGEVKSLVSQAVQNAGGKPYDGIKYLLALPSEVFDKVSVTEIKRRPIRVVTGET